MTLRAPRLYDALRRFCLGAFRRLSQEVESGAEIPFAFEEHGGRGRPPFYEYRPLVRGFVETRASRLAEGEDAAVALEELTREPAAAIFARAHGGTGSGGTGSGGTEALYRSVVVPLLIATAEACGGFDWDDGAFDRAYAELEASLFRSGHAYAAVAPLVGVSVGSALELGEGLRVRVAATGEPAALWPEATGLLPPGFGREPDRVCVLELERDLRRGDAEAPDAPGEIADAVTALRLATAGPVAAGPVLFERLDWRPYAIRPVLPIAAAQPSGEPIRLDVVRAALARDLLERLGSADEDPDLGEALDRWELSLFQTDPFRSEQLRASLAALLGGGDGLATAALRAALLLGESGRERAALLDELRALAGGDAASANAADAVRRALVETVIHEDRAGLVTGLDEALLGHRPRPGRPVGGAFVAARAAAG
ncbi:MAG: hypothetical protein E6G22_08285 [Actinobacteria bacterium]|nr:MAG: hypothetical protein E6G22_08285 [Actinomycetota bacterium]